MRHPSASERRYVAGQVIAQRYALTRPLAEGGMGVVWLARSLALDVDVAIKLVPWRGDRLAIAKRMTKEARVAARFGHPAIVRVFDFGRTEQGDPFLVMELLEGESLASLLEREWRLPALRAAQTLLPIADALATAHDRGIVHRDLKPDNIFLCHDEMGRVQPKLLDFGIVKMLRDDDPKLTTVGVAVGSAEYMSPEQARGTDDVDQRADIWSFCVVLYELVTGQLPFEGENYNSVLRAIIEDEPRSILDLEGGDPELWRIVERGLKKDREQRWPSMREVGEALAAWLRERGVEEDICAASLRTAWNQADLEPVKMETPPGKRSSRRLVPPVMLGTLLLGGLGSWAATGGQADSGRAALVGRGGFPAPASASACRSAPIAPMRLECAARSAEPPVRSEGSPEGASLPAETDPHTRPTRRASAPVDRRARPAASKFASPQPQDPFPGNLDFGF